MPDYPSLRPFAPKVADFLLGERMLWEIVYSRRVKEEGIADAIIEFVDQVLDDYADTFIPEPKEPVSHFLSCQRSRSLTPSQPCVYFHDGNAIPPPDRRVRH